MAISREIPDLPLGEAFSIWDHMKMLRDDIRVNAFKNAIAANAMPDGSFCEIGCGTGVFSIFAAAHFKRVVAVEQDIRLIRIAEENARRLNVADRIRFIQGDGKSCSAADIGGRCDVVMSELLSTWLATEPQIAVMNNILQNLLAPAGRIIPLAVSNILQPAEFDYTFNDIIIRGAFPEFADIAVPRPLAEPVIANRIDFAKHNELQFAGTASCIVKAGTFSTLRLSNIAHLAPGVDMESTDSAMPVINVPLSADLALKAPTPVNISYRISCGEGLERAYFSAVPEQT